MAYGAFQQKIDKRLGQIGRSVGQPYSAYRLGGASSGDFPSGWTNLGSVNAFHARLPQAKLEVGVERSGILFNFYVDASTYYLGDVFVCTDPTLNPGTSYGSEATILPSTIQFNGLALAWHMPVHVPICARLDRRVKIYRPAVSPQAMADGSSYWNETNDNDLPLILSAGTYSFGSAGAGGASYVPAGFMSVSRRSDYPFDKEPGIVRSLAWMVYLPPLPGYQMSEGDSLITEDGARYVVLGAYIQEAGLVGTQIIVDRKISQTG